MIRAASFQQDEAAATLQAAQQLHDQMQQLREQARAMAERARAQARQQADQNATTNGGARVIHVPPFDLPPFPTNPQFPGTTVPAGFGGGPAQGIPEAATIITLAFFAMIVLCVIGWPIARAFGRRIDRKTERTSNLPDDVTERLTRIEQQVEAIAIEMERVSEGQRFTTRLLTEMHELPALPNAAVGERVPAERR